MKVRLLFLVLLAGFAFNQAMQRLQVRAGIDFYHFWIVTQARRQSRSELGSPYRESARYAAVMNARVDAQLRRLGIKPGDVERIRKNPLLLDSNRLKKVLDEDQVRFLVVNLRRNTLDLTGSPLLYLLFYPLPAQYASAQRIYTILQALCFLGAVLLLWRGVLGRGLLEGIVLALLLAVLFAPFNDDQGMGNLNCVQLFLAALPLWVASRAPARAEGKGAELRWAALYLSLLVFYVLLKPNFALLAAGLYAHLWTRLPPRRALLATALAALVAALLIALPALYFGSAGVWTDWLNYIGGAGPSKLAYSVEKNNCSLPLHLVHAFGGSLTAWAGAMAALFGLGTTLALVLLGRGAGARGPAAALRAGWCALAREPMAIAGAGIALTLAISPLLWGHYLVATLIPILWLIGRGVDRLDLAAALAMLSAFIYSYLHIWIATVALSNPAPATRWAVALAWIPMIAAIYLHLRCPSPRDEPARSTS